MKSFVPFKNAGSWHAFFAVNFHQSLNFTKNFKVNSLLSFRVKHFSAAVTELLATMSNLLLLQAKVFSDAQKNVHLLSTSRYLICLKYNSNFACNLSENCRLQLCVFLTSHSQKKTYSFIFLRQILSCYNLKISFSKLVKVLVLELFYGTRTRVHFSISVLVLEVFCGTRTRKLSTRLHHCLTSVGRSIDLLLHKLPFSIGCGFDATYILPSRVVNGPTSSGPNLKIWARTRPEPKN